MKEWDKYLCCPRDGGPLVWIDDGFGCAGCRRHFPLRDGVVEFLGDGGEAAFADERRQEMLARDVESERFLESLPELSLRRRIELSAYLSAMRLGGTEVVLEIGCGPGAMTLRYVDRCALIVAIDFSRASLRALHKRLSAEQRRRVLLVQADASALPVSPACFDRVVSFQVFEHLPTPELRLAGLRAAASATRPGGRFVCSVYNWSKRKRREARRGLGDNTLKEGFHESGIYYYNFEAGEFCELLGRAGFTLEDLRGLDVSFRGCRLLGSLKAVLERWMASTRFALARAHLLMAVAAPRLRSE